MIFKTAAIDRNLQFALLLMNLPIFLLRIKDILIDHTRLAMFGEMAQARG